MSAEPSAEKDAGRFIDSFEADHAESMKDPEYAAAYRAAEERHARLIQQPCSEGNCVEFIDPETGENTGGWGPVGCPCQDADTTVTSPEHGERMEAPQALCPACREAGEGACWTRVLPPEATRP